jgi:hypothetical protein
MDTTTSSWFGPSSLNFSRWSKLTRTPTLPKQKHTAKNGGNVKDVRNYAFEDFLTREIVDGRNVVDDYLKRRGWRESASTKAYMRALRDSVPKSNLHCGHFWKRTARDSEHRCTNVWPAGRLPRGRGAISDRRANPAHFS